MTAQQRAAMAAAAEAGDYVRVVTIALQIAAKAARDGDKEQAIAIRYMVDGHKRGEALEAEYRRKRLEVATALFPMAEVQEVGPARCAEFALIVADHLIVENARKPIPKEATE